MQASHKLTHTLLALIALVLFSSFALAADPGLPYPDAAGTNEASDQKAGSLLFYNIYSSSAANPNQANTRVSITNTGESGAFVHLFFVDGATCAVADSYICLTKTQTMSFLASDIDPGITGYIVAVAVNDDGTPRKHNFLTGSLYVRLESGHAANLGAIAFAKFNDNNVISTDGTLAALFFDGANLAGSYNRAPRVVAVDDIPARADGNDTLLILNRVGGNLTTTANSLGSLFGILFDDAETPYSFTFSGGCQFRNSISNNFPRTTPRVENIITAGQSGWLKVWSTADIAILGSIINKSTSANPSASAYNGGRNLHHLTLSAAANFVIPVFRPSC